ncbi:hypothetical protein ACFFIF_10090 [Vagococcus entomophilus]|uniref:Uncharacterized protein n=1 Tax=Vagococcus entomophilus TaxID=1160095 RepID=A0A430AG69_9ENTE|nr:hypothetical protein [Vagococcus entomophilus]RSU06905.1 hypothetical protein CBF30_06495 [Vagococcus entomophilus]
MNDESNILLVLLMACFCVCKVAIMGIFLGLKLVWKALACLVCPRKHVSNEREYVKRSSYNKERQPAINRDTNLTFSQDRQHVKNVVANNRQYARNSQHRLRKTRDVGIGEIIIGKKY